MFNRCGYIALLGRPNSGKSTLLNAIVGQKVVGVSAKPQTTRNKILGIYSEDRNQILFLDTPGLYRGEERVRMNRLMTREAWSVLGDANLICYLVDVTQGWHRFDTDYFTRIMQIAKVPVAVLLSKVDKSKSESVLKTAELVKEAIATITTTDIPQKDKLVHPMPILISAKRKEMVKNFIKMVEGYIPNGPWLYPKNDLTDKSPKFICSELVRETIFRLFGQELPYYCAVRVNQLEEKPDIVNIYAAIITAKASHKGMLVGKNGSKIKQIGTNSRKALELFFGKKVFLDIHVTVDENWIDHESLISEYTYLRP